MKRIFIGIKIKPEKNLTDLMNILRNKLKGESVRWVEMENLHLTLLFIGETEEKTVKIIREKLKSVNNFISFDVDLTGLGIFKSLRDIRVIWIGINPADDLKYLKKAVDNSLSDLNLNLVKENDFAPHLTIARPKFIRDKSIMQDLINQFGKTKFCKLVVEKFLLIESKLTPNGPIYSIIEEYPLL